MNPSETETESVITFHDSFDRCKASVDFFDVFYDRFVNLSDEIRAKFEGVSLKSLQHKVVSSFYLIMMASDGSTAARMRLESLGEFHRELEIELKYFDLWLETLLSVVEERDPLYDAEVEHAWREQMGIGVEVMKEMMQ